MKKAFMNRVGMSVLEVMIAAGLLGALGLATTKLIRNQQKVATNIERDFDAKDARSDIFSILSNEQSCMVTFAGIRKNNSSFSGGAAARVSDLVPDTNINSSLGVSVSPLADSQNNRNYTAAQGGTGGSLIGLKLKLNNSRAGNRYFEVGDGLIIFPYFFSFIKLKTNANINAKDTEALGGTATQYYAIKIAAQVDSAGNILSCRASGGEVDSIWHYKNQPPVGIFYDTGDVQIGGDVAFNPSTTSPKLLVTDSVNDSAPLLFLRKTSNQSAFVDIRSGTRTARIEYNGIGANDYLQLGNSVAGGAFRITRGGNPSATSLSSTTNNSSVSTAGTLTLGRDVSVTRNLNIAGTLTAAGVATFNGGVAMTNDDITGVRQITAQTFSGGNFTGGEFRVNSDSRFKKDISEVEDALTKITQLNGVNFTFKDSGEKSMGVIAQEVEEVFPELVSYRADGFRTVNYNGLIAPVIEAIKEQRAIIERQNRTITELKKRIEFLEKKK